MVGEARLTLEAALDVLEADPREDRDAVVAALAVGSGLVAERRQIGRGKAASPTFVSCRQRTSG